MRHMLEVIEEENTNGLDNPTSYGPRIPEDANFKVPTLTDHVFSLVADMKRFSLKEIDASMSSLDSFHDKKDRELLFNNPIFSSHRDSARKSKNISEKSISHFLRNENSGMVDLGISAGG